jgi:hypothetical protein
VAVSTAGLGGLDQLLDFGRREVFAGAQFGIRDPRRGNCPIYIAELTSLSVGFMGISPALPIELTDMSFFGQFCYVCVTHSAERLCYRRQIGDERANSPCHWTSGHRWHVVNVKHQ